MRQYSVGVNAPRDAVLILILGNSGSFVQRTHTHRVVEHLANGDDVLADGGSAFALAHKVHELHDFPVTNRRNGQRAPAWQQVAVQPVTKNHEAASCELSALNPCLFCGEHLRCQCSKGVLEWDGTGLIVPLLDDGR